MTRVKLVVPENEKYKVKHANTCGEHYGYDGKTGTIIAGAGNNGVWVTFDGQDKYSYVGCPVSMLQKLDINLSEEQKGV